MYDNGHGVPQDCKEAVKWYRLVADQDDADVPEALRADAQEALRKLGIDWKK